MRQHFAIAVVGVALITACSSTGPGNATSGTTPGSNAGGTLAPPRPAAATSLAWDPDAAKAFNGEKPPADAVTVCGASDRRFLGELLKGSPLAYKVPKRLADVKPSQSQMLISGKIKTSTLGTGDFPFDHTMGSDFNAEVQLDEPYLGVGQENAKPIDSVHVELAAGQLPHLNSAKPPADEGLWRDMTAAARTNLQDGFVPAPGDRVLMMGSWIVDCGHQNFQTELHPITFVAVARIEGDATVVHVFYNPYGETQLYNPDPAKALAFEDPTRLTDPSTGPFPKSLIQGVLRLSDAGEPPFTSAKQLDSWALIEPNGTSPVPWRVCRADGKGKVAVAARFITRTGAEVKMTADGDNGCATVNTTLGTSSPGKPAPKVCVTPWAFLSEVASEEASGEEKQGAAKGDNASKIDLKSELGKFVQPQFKSRLEPDPKMNCYGPLTGPDLGGARPTTTEITTDANQLLPFYGTIVIRPAP